MWTRQTEETKKRKEKKNENKEDLPGREQPGPRMQRGCEAAQH